MTPDSVDDERRSFRQIIRSSSIIGGASVVGIVMGIVRFKAAALLLGPAGVGLIGLFQNLVVAGSTLASLGTGLSGSRQVSQSHASGDPRRLAVTRRSLLVLTVTLIVVGTVAFWLLREWIAGRIFQDPSLSAAMGWLSLGIAFAVGGTAQIALLTGLRRIADVARVSVASAVVSGVGGVALLLWAGERAIVPFVLLPAATALVAGAFFALRLPRPAQSRATAREMLGEWKTLAGLGFAFMLGTAAPLVGQLAARVLVQRELGADALGHFQAVWALSFSYIGFVLTAMAADYSPRLSAAIGDHAAANRMVNEQTEVSLLLSAPLLLMMLGGAPWLLQLLYSSAFIEAAPMLRWQVIGDLLKVASWPMGFLLLALGAGRMFVLLETAAVCIFVPFAWVGLPLIGVEAAGMAYLGMYAIYLPFLYLIVKRRTGFAWTQTVKRLLVASGAACIAVLAVAITNPWAGLVLASLLAAAAGIYALRRLGDALPAPIADMVARGRRFRS